MRRTGQRSSNSAVTTSSLPASRRAEPPETRPDPHAPPGTRRGGLTSGVISSCLLDPAGSESHKCHFIAGGGKDQFPTVLGNRCCPAKPVFHTIRSRLRSLEYQLTFD